LRKYWRNKSDNYHGNLVFIGVFLLFAGKQEKYRSLDDGGAVLEYRFILKNRNIVLLSADEPVKCFFILVSGNTGWGELYGKPGNMHW